MPLRMAAATDMRKPSVEHYFSANVYQPLLRMLQLQGPVACSAALALLICICALLSVPPAHALAPQQFNAGALLLTQKALNDGVNRYNQWFWDMIVYLEEQPTFPAESQWGGCGNPQYRTLSFAQ